MWYRPCEPEPGNTGGGKTIVKTNTNNSLDSVNNKKYQQSFRNPRVLAEMAIFTALATVLSTIVIYVMPQGGSITLASMVPIIWLALRRGPKVGITTGIIYGCIQFAMMPYIAPVSNPLLAIIQVLLDYPIAFGVLGLAGYFPKYPAAGAAVGVSLRFVSSFVSGAFIWAGIYAPGLDPYIYSAVYNGSYMLPELIITVFVIFLLQASKTLRLYL
jgi:thiamine transporter